jgi:hypothetical protein
MNTERLRGTGMAAVVAVGWPSIRPCASGFLGLVLRLTVTCHLL